MPQKWETLNPRCGKKSLLFEHRGTKELLLMPALCHTWSCEYCAHSRARLYIAAVIESGPTCKYEFTMPQGARRDARRDCAQYVHAIPKIMRNIRREFGDWEYFWTFELFRKGGAHVHGLGRGVTPTHEFLKAECQKFGLGFVVWVRNVDNLTKDVCQTTKYLFKAHSRNYMRALPSRRIHRSRKFMATPISKFAKPDDSAYELKQTVTADSLRAFAALRQNPRLTRAFIAEKSRDRFTLTELTREGDRFDRKATDVSPGTGHTDEHIYQPTEEDEAGRIRQAAD